MMLIAGTRINGRNSVTDLPGRSAVNRTHAAAAAPEAVNPAFVPRDFRYIGLRGGEILRVVRAVPINGIRTVLVKLAAAHREIVRSGGFSAYAEATFGRRRRRIIAI